jgi:hypothetical protein
VLSEKKPKFSTLTPAERTRAGRLVHLKFNEHPFQFNKTKLEYFIIKTNAEIAREYTPINCAQDSFELWVKVYNNGYLSPQIQEMTGVQLLLQETMELNFSECVYYGHGTGILPLIQMLQKNPALRVDLVLTNPIKELVELLGPRVKIHMVTNHSEIPVPSDKLVLACGPRQYLAQFGPGVIKL